MRIAIGNDRNGIQYNLKLPEHLEAMGHQEIDCGTNGDFPADYPIYGERVGRLVADGICDGGIVICATGIGICIAANKVKGIRAGLAYTDDVARLMKAYNDAKVIAFGQVFMTYEDVQKRTDFFLITEFGGYHPTRIQHISDIEEREPITQIPMMNTDNKHVRGGITA